MSAAYVGMGGRLCLLRVFKEQRLSIEAVLQDGFHTLVRAGPHSESPDGGLLHPFGGVMLAEAHDTESGSESLLGMRPALQDSGHQSLGIGSAFPCPRDDLGGGPLQISLVAFTFLGQLLVP